MNPLKTNKFADQIKEVIIGEYSSVMKLPGNTIGKFILIAVGIEFLGACLDKQHIKSTARGEKRFNSAITKLFPGKYHHFVKSGSVPNFYTDFRCPVIHQFNSEKTIFLCSRDEAGSAKHLSYNPEVSLILVAEDFYEELAIAGTRLIKVLENKQRT